MNKYSINKIVLILSIALTVLSLVVSVELRNSTLLVLYGVMIGYSIYSLFTTKVNINSIPLLGISISFIGKIMITTGVTGVGITLITGMIFQLFILVILYNHLKTNKFSDDIYFLGGFIIVLLQLIFTPFVILEQLHPEKIDYLNYVVVGMFGTILINNVSYGKQMNTLINLYFIQSLIFVITNSLDKIL